ncbi:hypothetical protein L198_03756 [Cryptococcus wingfieldii CBS 7118]|uniref:BTB domain-containing protein n=1 Tax=Cryptococcus wingfieldii CBS 7118 TaxID=1295528 RepID=A0A1E3JCB0_9TREE|nr:hypothetical protein L198_03756 [Cryptococcus wingfieldii CBS 7118]ODN98510.1 hypothetical protein L198_03756 [Cryptococcus wingfieldii CBS 7118]
MHNHQYPSDKSLSNIFESAGSPSPVLPVDPAPAYSALPDRGTEFFLAPILNGKVGDIELETVDGKRFLVHKKVLEQETVFFHIYYGFVPVWRLSGQPQAASVDHAPGAHRPRENAASPLSSFLCLPKLLASHLSRSPAAANLLAQHHMAQVRTEPSGIPSSPPPAFDDIPPPPPPPKDITAPTPTASPYTWAVPETSLILTAFLSLIYPPGVISPSPTSLLTSLDMTGRVVRAALGYQSAKALSMARDTMADWVDSDPVHVYSMASFFKFGDLAKLASTRAVGIASEDWPEDAKVLMGRTAAGRLLGLQHSRKTGLKEILSKPMEEDDHCCSCVRYPMARDVWQRMTEQLATRVAADSDLIELLNVDLRGGHCGECLVLLGRSVQRCLYEAKDLPRMV